MVDQSIVIRKGHLDISQRVVEYAMSRIDYLADYYSKDFANFIKNLESKLNKIALKDVENDSLTLSFTLDSIAAFKTIIYMYMEKHIKILDANDIGNITSILERLDGWIDEYMNIDGDYHVEAYIFNKELMRHSRL